MASDLLVFDSIATSNIPSREKSKIARWAEKMMGKSAGYLPGRHHVKAGANVVRQGGAALVTGGVLGALHAELKTGLDVKGVPVDGVGGALALVGSVALAHEEYGCDLANAGASALSVFAFRKSHDFVVEKRAQSKGAATTAHGESDVGEDPVVLAARDM